MIATALIGILPAAQAQAGPGVVASDLRMEGGHYDVQNDTEGHVQAVQIRFHVQYRYETGALSTESTRIQLHLAHVPDGFVTTLDKTLLEVPVRPDGGQEVWEVTVTVLPDRDVADEESPRAEFGLVKVVAKAQANGNVRASQAEAQQLIPLRTDAGAGPGPVDAGGAAASTGSAAGAAAGIDAGALVATGLLAAVAGAGDGALLVRHDRERSERRDRRDGGDEGA